MHLKRFYFTCCIWNVAVHILAQVSQEGLHFAPLPRVPLLLEWAFKSLPVTWVLVRQTYSSWWNGLYLSTTPPPTSTPFPSHGTAGFTCKFFLVSSWAKQTPLPALLLGQSAGKRLFTSHCSGGGRLSHYCPNGGVQATSAHMPDNVCIHDDHAS